MVNSWCSSSTRAANLFPLASGTQHEDGNDAHAQCGDHCADEGADARLQPALTVALQGDKAVADQPTGETTEQNGDEGASPGSRGWQCRHRAFGSWLWHGSIVEGATWFTAFAIAPALGWCAVRSVVVIPTYNEADNVERIVRAIRQHAADVGIIVVDDNSPDGTAQIAQRLGEELGDLQVLCRPGKQGLGSAYRAGMAAAIADGAEICVQMDADFSHDPKYLPALLAIVEHGADLAIGSRYVPGGRTENWTTKRRWLSRWGNRYAAGLLALAINDATAGYRAYSLTALVDKIGFEAVRAEGYGFQVEMTHRLVRANGAIVEFPIVFRDRTLGASKMSQNIISEAFVMVLRLWFQDRHGRRERRRQGM